MSSASSNLSSPELETRPENLLSTMIKTHVSKQADNQVFFGTAAVFVMFVSLYCVELFTVIMLCFLWPLLLLFNQAGQIFVNIFD